MSGIDLTDVHLVPFEDDRARHTHRAFARGPDDQSFYTDLYLSESLLADPAAVEKLVRSMLEAAYRHLVNVA